jgi:hypothetical protein
VNVKKFLGNPLSNKMIVHFDVFGTCMKHGFVGRYVAPKLSHQRDTIGGCGKFNSASSDEAT